MMNNYQKKEHSEKGDRLERINKIINNIIFLWGMNPLVENMMTGLFTYQSIINDLRNLSMEIAPYLDAPELSQDKKFIREINELCRDKPVIKHKWDDSMAGRVRKQITSFGNWDMLREKMLEYDRALRGWVSDHFKETFYSETMGDYVDEGEEVVT